MADGSDRRKPDPGAWARRSDEEIAEEDRRLAEEERARLRAEEDKAERLAPSLRVRANRPKGSVIAFWTALVLIAIGVLWGAAETHDQSCYTRVAAQVASGNTEKVHCLILPWNDPVTANEAEERDSFP